MKRRNSGVLTFTILSISLLTVMAGAAMAPALGVISEHFSDISGIMVQLIVSMPALFIIITNFFFPALCRLMRTRTLALTGLVLYIAAGAGAYFAGNIWTLLALRALLGVSVGMIMPLSTGLLPYYFPPEEQARLMGLAAFMSQVGGVIATFLSGFLCTLGWNSSFLVYLLGVVALVLVVAFLPNDRLETGNKTLDSSPDFYESECGVTKARKNPGHPAASLMRFAPSVIGMYLVMLLFFIFPTNFAIIAKEHGNIDINVITLIMVWLDVVAAVTGLLFGRMMRLLPRYMKYLSPLGFIAGYLCFSAGTSLWLSVAGSTLVGLANGIGVPYLNTIASIKGGKNAATTVMPLISAAMFLGQFTSPLIVSPLSGFLNGVTAPYKIGVIFSLIFLVQAYCSRRYQAISLPAQH